MKSAEAMRLLVVPTLLSVGCFDAGTTVSGAQPSSAPLPRLPRWPGRAGRVARLADDHGVVPMFTYYSEARTDPGCQRSGGPWYRDDSNTTSPNCKEHLAGARAVSDGLGKPILWWRYPLAFPPTSLAGAPATTGTTASDTSSLTRGSS